MKAAGGLDDIVLASTNYVNEDLNHQRKDKFVQFARGNVLMRIGQNDYSAKVIVGFTNGNIMVLYDVLDFSPTKIQIKKMKSAVSSPSNHKVENRSSTTDSSKRIPDSSAKNDKTGGTGAGSAHPRCRGKGSRHADGRTLNLLFLLKDFLIEA